MNEIVGFQVMAKNSLDPALERHRAPPLAEWTLPKRAPNWTGEAEGEGGMIVKKEYWGKRASRKNFHGHQDVREGSAVGQ